MNNLPLLLSILEACVLEPPPSEGSGWYTLCDGCSSSWTTPPSAGAVYRVRLTAGVSSDVTAGASWAGSEGEQLGSALVTVGDLDDDGLWDLSALTSGLGVLRTSDEPNVRFARIEAEPHPVGDLDGDGRLDLALSYSQADISSVLPGAELAAGGTFVLGDGWPVVPELAFGGAGPDLDLDGLADSLWVQLDWPATRGTRLRVVLGADVGPSVPLTDAALEWVEQRDAMNGGGSWDLGDVDGDGARDLGIGAHVSYSHLGRGVLAVYSGAALAEGRVEELASLLAPDEGSGDYRVFDVVPLGDLDLDGKADLAVTWGPPDGAALARIVGGAELGTGDLDQIGAPIPLAGQRTTIDGRDLDGDGWAELLVHDVYQETGGVFTGADLAAGRQEPSWRYTGGTSAVLSGLDPDGALVLWAADIYAER